MASSNQLIVAAKRKGGTMKKSNLNGKLVIEALKATDNPNGTSNHCLKTYIAANYLIDIGRVARFLSIYLKKAVEDGTVNQIKGKGLSGSFKLASQKDVNGVIPKKQMVVSKKKQIIKNVRTKQTRSNTRAGTKRSSQHLDVEEDPESKKAKTETEMNSEVVTQERVIKRVRFTPSTKEIDGPSNIPEIQEGTSPWVINFKVIEVIGILGKENGCSLRTIKKYVEENCALTKRDISSINGIVKSSIESGVLQGTRGTDLRGLFKLAEDYQ